MSPSTHSSAAVFNITELLSRVDNDQELACELLQLFKDECPSILRDLQEAISRGDMATIERAGHSLKGMLANLSIHRAAKTAAMIEQLGNSGEGSGLLEALATLESQLAALMPELDLYLSKHS
jgi:two-component system, sensor histidine kinase and response regulator